MRVAGIDPGVHGAVAVHDGHKVTVHDLPVEDHRVDPVALGELLDSLDRIAIEDNRANGGNGSLANFSMGYSMGLCIGVVGMLGIPLMRVKPQAWQQAMGLGNVKAADRKDASRQRAREIFPSATPMLKRKADHNRAEALLICEYARRQP